MAKCLQLLFDIQYISKGTCQLKHCPSTIFNIYNILILKDFFSARYKILFSYFYHLFSLYSPLNICNKNICHRAFCRDISAYVINFMFRMHTFGKKFKQTYIPFSSCGIFVDICSLFYHCINRRNLNLNANLEQYCNVQLKLTSVKPL